MARPHIHTYQEINSVIKKVADIPSQVDAEGFILADGIVLYKNVYDPVNGNYELHVRDKKNDKWKSFDSEDNPNFIEDAARCFVEFYNAKQEGDSKEEGDSKANLVNAYAEIRKSQTSLISLVESVPGVTIAALPVTTVKLFRIDTELTINRNGQEVKVFESFFPEDRSNAKYMCGIHVRHEQDGTPVKKSLRSRREFLPGLIQKYTAANVEPISEQDINRLKYLMSDISSILAKHGASLDAVPGGLKLRTGISRPESVNLVIVETEVE